MDIENFTDKPGQITSSLLQKLGIRVVKATADQCVAVMPVDGNTQVGNVLHGGASAALAETAASVAASVHAADLEASGRQKLMAVGTELTIAHLRPGTSGIVTATAAAEHLGARRTVHAVRIEDEKGRLLASGQATNMIVERRI